MLYFTHLEVSLKTVGLITEYNPFHNGHKYHIEEAKRVTGADFVVVVMSGNFVQRGTPALIEKYQRTTMALSCGADLVFELPVCYATSSAEFFALGAVTLLHQLGFVDYLCFGSESGKIETITKAATLLSSRDEELYPRIQEELKLGNSYPKARANALSALMKDESNFLNEPNNILGIEYVKALQRLQSPIKPVTIKRKSSHYHDDELSSQIGLNSASAIRKYHGEHTKTTELEALKDSIPDKVYQILMEQYQKSYPVLDDDISPLLNYQLLYETKESLEDYLDSNSDLADRILNVFTGYQKTSDLALSLKAKNYTYTRISRVLLHVLLHLKKYEFKDILQAGKVPYARLLGLRTEASPLLRMVPQDENFKVITKVSSAIPYLSDEGKQMLQADILATHLYYQIVQKKFGTVLCDEYRHGIVIVPTTNQECDRF